MGSIRRKGKFWYFRYYDAAGKQHEISLGTKNRSVAERLKERYENQYEANFSPEEISKLTFGQVTRFYLDILSPQKSPRTLKDYATTSRRLIDHWEKLLIRKMSSKEVLALIQKLETDGYARETVRKTMMLARQIFRYAIRKGFIADDPTDGIKVKTPKKQRRIRWLTTEELNKVFEAGDELYPHLSHVFRFLYYTGLRKSEMMSLQWSDIDMETGVLSVNDSKTLSGIRKIPLSDDAKKILEALPRESEWVFSNPQTGEVWSKYYLGKVFKRILKKAGINERGISIHVLRHTFASQLAMAGVSLDIIRDLLGHSSVVITEIYAHLSPDHHRNALDRLPKLDRD